MLSDAMKYADATTYEAAEVLGLPPVNRFRRYAAADEAADYLGGFAVFTMVFTDYGVPLAVGGRFDTLPVYLYQEVIGLQNFQRGFYRHDSFLIPAVVTFLIDLRKKMPKPSAFPPSGLCPPPSGPGSPAGRFHGADDRLRPAGARLLCRNDLHRKVSLRPVLLSSIWKR